MSEMYKTTDSIVAFIDVLGLKEAIMSDADKSPQIITMHIFSNIFTRQKLSYTFSLVYGKI